MQPIFYGTVAPLLAYFAVKKLIFDPIEAKRLSEEKKKESKKVQARVAEAKKDAEAAVDLMQERHARIKETESANKGLIIIKAIYGQLLDGKIIFSNCDES